MGMSRLPIVFTSSSKIFYKMIFLSFVPIRSYPRPNLSDISLEVAKRRFKALELLAFFLNHP